MDELLPTARDVMTDDYLALRPSLPLIDAVNAIEQHPEDTAFVLDDEQRLVGVLSEKDCLRALAARAYDTAIAETVRDVMCAPPTLLTPDADAYTVAQAFVSGHYGMLPVIEDGRLAGAVAQISMLRAFIEVFRHRSRALHDIEQTAHDLSERPESKEQMQRVAANLDRDQLADLFRQSTRKED